MQTLDVISVNFWQMLVSLANLLLLYWIVKRFLYLPVKNMLISRQKAIEGDYAAARDAKEKALSAQAQHEEQLKNAKKEAEGVIRSAVQTADLREQEILAEAKRKAEGIVRRAEEDAALEKKKAEDQIRREIAEVSSLVTEKLLEREIRPEDHENWIRSFVDQLGEDQ